MKRSKLFTFIGNDGNEVGINLDYYTLLEVDDRAVTFIDSNDITNTYRIKTLESVFIEHYHKFLKENYNAQF